MTDPSCYTPPSIATLKELVDLFGRFMANDAETPASATLDSLQGMLKQRLNFIPYATSAELQGALAGIDAPQLVLDLEARILYAVIKVAGQNQLTQITSPPTSPVINELPVPVFRAYTPGSWKSVTTINTPLTFTTAQLNTGGHYDPATSRFTAPGAGSYCFVLNGLLSSATDGRVTFAINGTPQTTQMQVLVGEAPLSFTAILSLNAGDAVTCSTGNVNTVLQYFQGHTTFAGWKIS